MPKAKSQENKENAAAAEKVQETEAYKLEAGKEDDDSGSDSEESEEEVEEETKAAADQPVCIEFSLINKKWSNLSIRERVSALLNATLLIQIWRLDLPPKKIANQKIFH